jgi:hypothetical protein
VDLADQGVLEVLEEQVVLEALVVQVDLEEQAEAAEVVVPEHILTVKVVAKAPKVVVAVEPVLLAELEVSAAGAIQAVTELQMLEERAASPPPAAFPASVATEET